LAASQLVTRSTRHPVVSSHGQLVTGQLVTWSTRHAVDSSQRGGQLVTSKHQSCTANNVLVPQLLGRSFQKAKKNSQLVVTRMQDFTSEFLQIFRGWHPRRPGPSQLEGSTTPSHTQHTAQTLVLLD